MIDEDVTHRDKPKTLAELRADPYVRMLLAAQLGKGVKLSVGEVWHMMNLDDAMFTAASSLLSANGYRAADGKLEKHE